MVTTACLCNSNADLSAISDTVVLGRMQAAVKVLLQGLGEDIEREGLVDTPRRVAKAWLDIAGGCSEACSRVFGKALFHEPILGTGASGMVVVRDITFAAICEQTLLPFHGRCHIAYTPRDGVILGLSKLARVTKCLACKLQQQAAFAQKLMQAVQSEVGPLGVAVVVQANHLRGAQQPTPAITSAASGIFHDSTTGMFLEFLTLLQLSGNAAVVSALRGLSHESSRDGVAAAAAAAAASGEQQTSPSWPPEALAQLMKCNLGSTGVSSTDMAAAVIELLEGVGEDPGRPGLQGSPQRYVEWLLSATAGYHMSLPGPYSCCSYITGDTSRASTAAPDGPAIAALRVDSPEAPATPEDHSPDASYASSDDSLEDTTACCLSSRERARVLAHRGQLSPARLHEPGLEAGAAGQIHTFSTQFTSQCEHHLLPFYGSLRVALEVPDALTGHWDGGKCEEMLQHLVLMYSKRLQVQERLGQQIAEGAMACLGATSVLVVMDSVHMCMVARGVEKHSSSTLTTSSKGRWERDAAARLQALQTLLG